MNLFELIKCKFQISAPACNKTVLYFFVCSVVFFFFTSISYSGEFLVIDNHVSSMNPCKYMEYHMDKDNDLSFSEITAKERVWNPIILDSVNFGYSRYAYWFRLKTDVRLEKDESYFFEVKYKFIDHIEFYKPLAEGGHRKIDVGNNTPFTKKSFNYRHHIFQIEGGGGEQTIYIKLISSRSLSLSPFIWNETALINKMSKELPLFWCYYGILFVLFVYNLFFFLSIRETAFLYAAMVIFSFSMIQLYINGFGFQFLWPDSVWLQNRILNLSIFSTGIFLALYIQNILALKENMPMMNTTYNRVLLPSGILLFLMAFFYSENHIYKLNANFWIFFVIFLFSIPILKCLATRSLEAFHLTVGFAFFFIGVILYDLKFIGILPSNNLTEWSMQTGSLFMMLVISFSLSNRIRLMRQKLFETRDNLKKSVEFQTFELNNANLKMENINNRTTRLLEKISTITEEIVQGAGQLSGFIKSLSKGAEEQANTLSEITSSLSDMEYHTTSNAENSIQANELSQFASQTAKKGVLQIDEMVAAMDLISDSSNEIYQIIKTIDDIAFRTNLLALNASIEAARAGRHGRGFSVVAQEIRSLASNSAKAAKETATFVKSSIEKVNIGNEIAKKTVVAFEEIKKGVAEMSGIIGEIAVSNRGQSKDISRANAELAEIDTVVNKNSSNAKETFEIMQQMFGQVTVVRKLLSGRSKV